MEGHSVKTAWWVLGTQWAEPGGQEGNMTAPVRSRPAGSAQQGHTPAPAPPSPVLPPTTDLMGATTADPDIEVSATGPVPAPAVRPRAVLGLLGAVASQFAV